MCLLLFNFIEYCENIGTLWRFGGRDNIGTFSLLNDGTILDNKLTGYDEIIE